MYMYKYVYIIDLEFMSFANTRYDMTAEVNEIFYPVKDNIFSPYSTYDYGGHVKNMHF